MPQKFIERVKLQTQTQTPTHMNKHQTKAKKKKKRQTEMTGSMLGIKKKILSHLLQLWLNPCVFILSFQKKKNYRIRSFGPAVRDSKLFKTHSFKGGTKNLRRDRRKKNYKMAFFFFILVHGDQTEPHAASQETPWSWWERELSDYCFGQWLASVWGRGGKMGREWVRERGAEEGEGRREGRRERGREEAAAAAAVWKSRRGKRGEKKRKSCSVLFFTGRTLGLEETRGSRASHQLPHMSFTHSFKQYRAPPDCIREARQWNGRPLQPVRPVHGAPGPCSCTPRASSLLPPPHPSLALSPCFCYVFSTAGHIFFSLSTASLGSRDSEVATGFVFVSEGPRER